MRNSETRKSVTGIKENSSPFRLTKTTLAILRAIRILLNHISSPDNATAELVDSSCEVGRG
jgi:hypothetical protein